MADADLARFADAVMSIAHRIEPRGLEIPGRRHLTPREVLVLHEVAVSPGITATRIARGLGLQRSNLSATLHALEREGLLAQTAAAAGRGVGFQLTDLAQGELALVRAHRAERLRTASPDVLRAVVDQAAALARLAESIGEQSE